MYKRMLVPLDGSQLSESVLPYADELAGRLDLDLYLLHVSPPQETQSITVYESYVTHMAEVMASRSREVQAGGGATRTLQRIGRRRFRGGRPSGRGDHTFRRNTCH
jgi:nucleotide-binding universal stress UspA family protein